MSTQVYDRHFNSQDNLRLFYRVFEPGKAEAAKLQGATPANLLCIPGLTRNHRDFSALAIKLGENYRVLCPDLRGRGHSEYDRDPSQYHIEIYIKDIIQLLAAENISEFVIIGTSLGGILAMVMAQLYGGLLKAVVLNDVGGYVPLSAMQTIADYVNAAKAENSWADATATVKLINQDTFTNLNEGQWLETAQRLYRESEDGRIIPDYGPLLKQNVVATEIDLWTHFDNLQGIPTLLIRGENSGLLTEKTALEMLAKKPDMQRVNVPHRGHAPFLDETESLEGISKFLETVLQI